MGPLGVPELAIILVIVVIIFGVGKLPEVGGALGKGLKEFKAATDNDNPDAPAPHDTEAVAEGTHRDMEKPVGSQRPSDRAEDI